MSLPVDDPERLGKRLRALREQSGISLRGLARELGISASAISQIEHGTLRPSVSRLIAFVAALDVPLAAVFEQAPDDPVASPDAPVGTTLRRAAAAAPLELDGGVLFRRLSPAPLPGVEFFESTYPPGAVSSEHGRFLAHAGYEVGTVTSGELTIEFEDEVLTLAAGDSITFPCLRPHILGNRSTATTAVATWLIVNR